MELVGRRAELDHLDGALERARCGRRTAVLLRGPAGIGKSALAAELRARAERSGARVAAVAVTESETPIGWSGVATLLRRLPDVLEGRPDWQRDLLRGGFQSTSHHGPMWRG